MQLSRASVNHFIFSIVFTGILHSDLRWVVMGGFLFILMIKKYLVRFIDAYLLLFLVLYTAWSFFTSFWSMLPIISFLKSITLILSIFTFVSLGIVLMERKPVNRALDYLMGIAFLSLISGIAGLNNFDVTPEKLMLYKGLTGGSNMFGVILAMGFPYFLFETYRYWRHRIKRWMWLSFTVLSIVFVLATFSRAAILVIILTMIGFFNSFKLSRKLLMSSSVLLLLTGIIIFYPTLTQDLVNKYVYKNRGDVTKNMFSSRQGVWDLSLAGAAEAGLIGLGFGVTYENSEVDLSRAIQSKRMGAAYHVREKGNSQLAIIEETGILGFILYSLIILSVIGKLIKLFLLAREPDDRIIVGIISGSFLGMIVHSCFEAWWTSPLAAESMYFWTFVGVIRGLEINLSKKWMHYEKFAAKTSSSQILPGLA